MREHDLRAADGTRLRAWRTESAGPTVLLCPGLGTVPEAWPALLLPSSGVRVLSWYNRGTMGSERPADPARVALADHVADAIAVMDDAGVERCVVVGWSVGVMVAAELALRHPSRVSGLLLAAGVPGDLFGGVLGVLRIPGHRRVALAAARLLHACAPLVDRVLHGLPVTRTTAKAVQHSGLMLPGADPGEVVRTLRRFLRQDWRWYTTLALALADVPEADLTGVTCPVTVLAAKYDVIADPRRVVGPVAVLPQARTRVVPTSHFVPLEAPEELVRELSLLLARVAAVERARP